MNKLIFILLSISIFIVFSSNAFAYNNNKITVEEMYDELVEQDILYNDLHFDLESLDKSVERRWVAWHLAYALNIHTNYDESIQTFTDVPVNWFFYYSVEALVKHKIINGIGDGTFQPKYNITLQDFAIIMVRTHEVLTGIHLEQNMTSSVSGNVSSYAQPLLHQH
ncbi:S-layer homology domain-containing protein [Chengkuizengella axinellae]|uniref:S-layer homology domain-containing protein n=1 Tax=Chengkuizengella axinellae TaxID=3064388 RepID=A0ABT9IY10_9BACL|nr:S-layer homology domain-containing protein [Chengkuizengella sp. 2205SS18-9]MDP5274246.1 S-layer homology domain-containing protein [Chengkuizengella sp. 2205SS18-9]